MHGGGRLRTPFWTAVAGAPPAKNRLIVDPNELVFAAWVRVPRTGGLRLRHAFPHARSVAWSVYDPMKLAPIDVLRDRDIVPDTGSANPYVPGANRDAGRRNYTVTVSRDRPTSRGCEGNTLATNGRRIVLLFYRLYVPDRGRGRLGGAGLPYPVMRSPRWRGAAAALPNTVVWNATAVGLTVPYLALRTLGRKPTFPARADGCWDAYFNLPRLAEPLLRGTALEARISMLPMCPRGPAADWGSDSALAFAYVDRRLGPARAGRNILVLRGRMPRTPRTVGGDAAMDGDVDLRYWSVCIQTALPLGVTGAGLYDEQIPLDAERRYTIVISTPEDRPGNATPAHGVAWLDWGVRGDGYGRREAGMLALRNQDPSPGFGHAIQDVDAPGRERAVMGEWLPTLEYMTRGDFEVPWALGSP